MPEGSTGTEQMSDLMRFGPKIGKEKGRLPEKPDWGKFVKKEYKNDVVVFGPKKTNIEGMIEENGQVYKAERGAIERGVDMPTIVEGSFKVSVARPVEEWPEIFNILAEQFPTIGYLGIVDGEKSLSLRFFSLTVREMMDVMIPLSRAVRNQLGESESGVKTGREVVDKSGLGLSQGDETNKELARERGVFEKYYTKDGEMLAVNEERYMEYRTRRHNQMEIEENLVEYHGMGATERLLKLQKDAYNGVDDMDLGVRSVEVVVGKYEAPARGDLGALLQQGDTLIKRLVDWNKERFDKDFDYALRAMSVGYLYFILTHPLRNGNGQSCYNLVSSYLFEGGYKRVFFDPFKTDRLRTRAFSSIQTIEAPTVESTKRADETRDEGLIDRGRMEQWNKQKYTSQLLTLVSTGEGLNELLDYVKNGRIKTRKELRESHGKDEGEAIYSFLGRAGDIKGQLMGGLVENPKGTKRLEFGEMQKAQEQATQM